MASEFYNITQNSAAEPIDDACSSQVTDMEATQEPPTFPLPTQSLVAPLSPPPRRVVGFVVGLENYQPRRDQMPVVDYAHNDANAFADALRQLYGVTNTEMLVLLDSDATKARLEYELRETIRGLNHDDLFVFYYAGHGYHNAQGNRITAWDSSAWNAETTLLIREVLLDPLSQSSCRQALLFIDACAVALRDLVASRDVLTSLDPKELRDFLGGSRYCATFLSCSPGEKSYPSEKLRHGIWTYFLLRALRGEAPEALGPSRFMTDVGLRDYLRVEVPKFMKGNETTASSQTPMAILNATSTVGILELLQLPLENRAAEAENQELADGVLTSQVANLPASSRNGRASIPNKVIPKSCHLTLVHSSQLTIEATHVATLTLITDEPDYLSKSIEEIKQQLSRNVLLDKSSVASDATLAELLSNVSAQSRLLDWLSTASFSAHLYFASPKALSDEMVWPLPRRQFEFIALPLIHRLSDKSISVLKLNSNFMDIGAYLDVALAHIENEFHRAIPRPLSGGRRRIPGRSLLELAELVLICCQKYLADPSEPTARAIFAHVRTRLKYATNVATGDRHTRDKNPLP